MSFSFDKVITGTCSFVSIILNVVPHGATIAASASEFTTQFLDQVKINSTLQLINGIFKALKKNYVNILAE